MQQQQEYVELIRCLLPLNKLAFDDKELYPFLHLFINLKLYNLHSSINTEGN